MEDTSLVLNRHHAIGNRRRRVVCCNYFFDLRPSFIPQYHSRDNVQQCFDIFFFATTTTSATTTKPPLVEAMKQTEVNSLSPASIQ
jgi:hypothetical protein